MKTIKLINALKVGGQDVKELPFDTSTFGTAQLARANRMAAEMNNGVFVPAQETDYSYHMAIAQIIVETSSKGEISTEDLKRIQGPDLFTLQRAGRDFLLESVSQDPET